MKTRTEKDALGELTFDDACYYGIQTERARQNFAVSGRTIGEFPRYLWSLVTIKKAAALANCDIGALDREAAEAVVKAADIVLAGGWYDQFPLDVFQGGGGTSTNMNANEVLANLAQELLTGSKGYDRIHPNTHVNMCQSTNDVIPSAMKLACWYLLEELLGSLAVLEEAAAQKSAEFADVVKLGRTCLQDAVPLTLGQEFSGYLAFIQRQKKRIVQLQRDFLAIPLGATAVGTGMGTVPGYVNAVFSHLRELTGLDIKQEANLFDGLQNGDIYIDLSARLKALAAGLSKMATDFRILSSGPRAGFGEIVLPALQPGSSIMPGKINPVIPELVNQVCYRVIGNDVTVTMAVEGGELDLNVWEPVIITAIFDSCTLLANTMKLFAEKCIAGIRADRAVCREYAGTSLALSAVIAAKFDYPTGSKLAAYAREHDISIQQASVETGLLSAEEAGELLDPEKLV
jgi:aspartate ammonia-lyase